MRGGWHHAAKRSSCCGEASHQRTDTFAKASRATGGSYLDHQAETGSSAPPLLTTTTTTPLAQEVSSLVPLSLPQAFLAFLAGRVPAGAGHIQVPRDDYLVSWIKLVTDGSAWLRSTVQVSPAPHLLSFTANILSPHLDETVGQANITVVRPLPAGPCSPELLEALQDILQHILQPPGRGAFKQQVAVRKAGKLALVRQNGGGGEGGRG